MVVSQKHNHDKITIHPAREGFCPNSNDLVTLPSPDETSRMFKRYRNKIG